MLWETREKISLLFSTNRHFFFYSHSKTVEVYSGKVSNGELAVKGKFLRVVRGSSPILYSPFFPASSTECQRHDDSLKGDGNGHGPPYS